MLDGFRPDTCVVAVDRVRLDSHGSSAEAFDLIEFGCDGERRVLLARRRIEGRPGQVGISSAQLDHLIWVANEHLRARRGCTCR